MDTRRDFLRKSMLLSGAAGTAWALPESIRRAMAIDPKSGSTYLDAEHVVILMQENRSFDHCFGALQGVRGLNDPRVVSLPDKNLAWLQTNAAGETYTPFRFDIKDTKITWMGSVPHNRHSQVDAYNLGKHDQWLNAKRPSNKKYADMPLTMGHYTREDIPFNYALADAFTICDQAFSSAMTSTWPNRLFLWTGTIREEPNGQARAHIRNDLQDGEAKWKTFPERLEENGISWKVYQNDINCGGGFTGEERAWLSNYHCNPLELFARYNVKFSPRYTQSLQQLSESLPGEIKELETKLGSIPATDNSYKQTQTEILKKREVLDNANKELEEWSQENYNKLSDTEKELFRKAFSNNAADPDYHQMIDLTYQDGDTERQVSVPKGDLFHQFREDVNNGKLPTVSWLAGPQNFSDHPSAPWYGAWYVSEILDILTKNPEVWKKTIFILTYDENDGYFDHIPPFVAPDPFNPKTGKCSKGINTEVEYISLAQELEKGIDKTEARGGPVGLGFRIPLIIASPWSRGGYVCSEVFDHTSALQFLEDFLNKKFDKDIKETNISQWRRTITGDLTAAFRSYNGEKAARLPFLERAPFIEKIYNAKFKKDPSGFRPLTPQEIAQINNDPSAAPFMIQEPGIRPSCGLAYQLSADSKLSADRKQVELTFSAANKIFGKRSAGSPFNVYLPGKYYDPENTPKSFEPGANRSYAVAAGEKISDTWPIQSFENGIYHLRVYGPNGFFRECKGTAGDPPINIETEYEIQSGLTKKPTGNLILILTNADPRHTHAIEIKDNAYRNKSIWKTLEAPGSAKSKVNVILNLGKSFGWYDFSVRVTGFDHFEKRYAGHVETGNESFTDPFMGRVEI